MSEQQKPGFYGWWNVVILFLSYCLLYGFVFYGYSVVFPVMIKATKWARGDASIALTIRVFLIGFGAPAVAYMIKRWSVRTTMLIGGFLTVAGMVLLGTVVDQIWEWTILWGLVVGFGVSAAGLLSFQTNITFWFSKNRGMAIGLVSAGAALGGFAAQPLFTAIMGSYGSWKVGWLSAGVLALLGTVVIFWLKDKPADYGQYPDGISPEKAKSLASAGKRATAWTYRTSETWTLQEAIRTRVLWFIILMYALVLLPLYLVTAHGVLHLTDLKYSSMQAAYVISAVLLGAGVSRFPIGWLADYVEARWISAVMFACMFVTIFVIWKAPSFNALIVCGFLFGFCYGARFALMPTMIGNYFGPAAFAPINGFLYPFSFGAGALVPMVAGYIYDINKSYDLAYIVILALIAASMMAAVLSAPPKKAQGKVKDAALSVST